MRTAGKVRLERQTRTAGNRGLFHIKMFGFYPVVDGQWHDILKEEIREITGALTKLRKSIG